MVFIEFMIYPTSVMFLFFFPSSFSNSCSRPELTSAILSISCWIFYICWFLKYRVAVICWIRCRLSSLTYSISALIRAFLSFNFLFSFLRLMKRSRSHSTLPSEPLSFISGSFTTLLRKTSNLMWLSNCYFRSIRSLYFYSFCLLRSAICA